MSRKLNEFSLFLDGEASGAPGLAASKCKNCGRISTYSTVFCPRCMATEFEVIAIGQKAYLVEFAVVNQSTDLFEAPYVIGLVRTEEGVLTYAQIQASDIAKLEGNCPLNLNIIEHEQTRCLMGIYTVGRETTQ